MSNAPAPAPAPASLLPSLAGMTALLAGLALPSPASAAPCDGVYTGKSAVTLGAGNSVCGKDHTFRAQVTDGGFLYTWDATNHVIVPVKIAADGTVTGEGGVGKASGATATGKLTGTTLEIDLKGKQCARHLSLKKV